TDARAGRFEAADAALSALLDRLAAADDPRLRMRALAVRAIARVRVGRLTEARADADAALAVPSADTYAAEFAAALNARAVAAVALLDLDAANLYLGRARLQFERLGDALGVARVDDNLGLLDYERGALAEADLQISRALQLFDEAGAVRELSSALAARMLVQSAQLRHADALATSERFWALAAQAGDPLQRRGSALRRARALAAVGRLRESRALLAAIRADNVPGLAETRDLERLLMLESEIALREGRADDAARAAAALPVEPPPAGDDDLRARAALLRERVLGGGDDGADAEARTLAAIAAAPATHASPFRALALAERARRHGRLALADDAYRLALRQAEAGGLPSTIAAVAEAYVPWLLERGRLAEAAAQVGRVGVWADRDFDCALLRLRLARAQGAAEFERAAAADALRLAGERPIPRELLAHVDTPATAAP
ncbi:MAG TPA: hypothetical protein VGC30_00080, partial [Dokdonella sp.]